MENLILSDLQKGFVYYPSSGTDFGVMKSITNYYNGDYPTFIYCDAGRPITEVLRFYYHTSPLNFMDNKLGLNGFEILTSLEWSSFKDVAKINDIQTSLIKRYGPNYNDYISTIFDQRVVRYELRYKDQIIVLYFIRYEAVAVLNWLLNLIQNTTIKSGFVLSQPGYGWTESKYEEALINTYQKANLLPNFLLTDAYWWTDSFEWKTELRTENKMLTLKEPINK